MKTNIGVVAVILTFVGYIPYIVDTLKGKTKPHIYTWFIWGLVTAIAFALQVSDGAGFGAYVTLAAAIVCFFIFIIAFKSGEKNITRLDTLFFILSLCALGIWLLIDQPLLSVILVSIIDILGFIPTIRKSWDKPREETLLSYVVNTFRFSLALIALQKYTIITMLYPLTWVVANGLFSLYLIYRRSQIKA